MVSILNVEDVDFEEVEPNGANVNDEIDIKTGAFLGMGSELSETLRILLLIVLPVIVLVSITIYTYIDKSLDKTSIIGFSLIIGGGIGNIFDRIVYGSVTDFLYLNFGGVLKTGIFNIADLSVTSGMILILISSFKKKH